MNFVVAAAENLSSETPSHATTLRIKLDSNYNSGSYKQSRTEIPHKEAQTSKLPERRYAHTDPISTLTFFPEDLENAAISSKLDNINDSKHGRIFRREISEDKLAGEGVQVSWREIMKHDKLAFIIWNITDKNAGFKSRDESVEKCLSELKDRSKALAPYLVSTTVRESGYFLRDFNVIISKYSHLHDLIAVKNYYNEYTEVLQDYETYSAAMNEIIQGMDQKMKSMITCAQRRFCSCFSSRDVQRYEEQFSILSGYNLFIKSYLFFGYYIDPTLRLIFIAAGLLFNCELLAIFVKNEDIRTEANIMVLNIAVSNILILITYLPLQYVHFYFSSVMPHEEFSNDDYFIMVQSLFISSSVLSLLALRIQHHIELSRATNPSRTLHCVPPFQQGALFILPVWIISVGVAIFTFIFNDHPKMGYIVAPLTYIVLYILVLPLALSQLKLSADKSRVQCFNSNVIIALFKLFWVTHAPLFTWLLLEGLSGFILKLASINYFFVDFFICYIYFSYACLSPLVLWKESDRCKTMLDKYVCSCWRKENIQQDIVMTVVRPSETESHSAA